MSFGPMSSPSQRVRSVNKKSKRYSAQLVRLLLNDVSNTKRRSNNRNIQTVNSLQQAEESSVDQLSLVAKELKKEISSQLVFTEDKINIDGEQSYTKSSVDTDDQLSMVVKELKNEISSLPLSAEDRNNIGGEMSYSAMDVEQEYGSEERLSDLHYIQTDKRSQQTEKSSIETEDQLSMIVQELKNDISPLLVFANNKINIYGEDFCPPADVEQECGSGAQLSDAPSHNSELTQRHKRTACSDEVVLEDGNCTPKLPSPGIEAQVTQLINLSSPLNSSLVPATYNESRCLIKLQSPVYDYTSTLDLPEPDPIPSSSSVVANTLLPIEVPSSVTLTFESSDEEDESSQSHHPMPTTSKTTSLPQRNKADLSNIHNMDITPGPGQKFISGPHLSSETTADSAQSWPVVPAENQKSMNLHSEVSLPVDNEELKPEVDISSSRPYIRAIILKKPNFLVPPVFVAESQDAMFLEEVSMTVRQFNELLQNLYLYQCLQVPSTESRLKLEAVLNFLVKGESIADLTHKYRISKYIFTKYLPEVLDAIFKMLGLLKLEERENPWSGIQKRFTECFGLPNCCGVLNAKTIITWRPSALTRLPVITVTDADYTFLYLDLEASIEEQGIDFKSTRAYAALHVTKNSALILPKLGFVVGDKDLPPTNYVSPLYSKVGEDMPIPYLYNSRVERALRASENALGILTSKFKIYDKIMTLTPNVAKAVVKATCALHNWLKQSSPGYLTPSLVDVETNGEVTHGSWRITPRQILQPVSFFHPKNRRGGGASYDRKRDTYAFNLYYSEQTKNGQQTK